MSDPGEHLRKELDQIHVTEGQLSALKELAYTASERGIIPFAVCDDVDRQLVALVELSFTYRDGVPSHLRM